MRRWREHRPTRPPCGSRDLAQCDHYPSFDDLVLSLAHVESPAPPAPTVQAVAQDVLDPSAPEDRLAAVTWSTTGSDVHGSVHELDAGESVLVCGLDYSVSPRLDLVGRVAMPVDSDHGAVGIY